MLKDILEGYALLNATVDLDRDWKAEGRCARHPDPDLWFDPTEAESPRYAHLAKDARATARLKDRSRAKEMCRACPVRAECLQYATGSSNTDLDTGQFGIWGGLDKTERTKLTNLLAARAAA